jgi:hypothetical protein
MVSQIFEDFERSAFGRVPEFHEAGLEVHSASATGSDRTGAHSSALGYGSSSNTGQTLR